MTILGSVTSIVGNLNQAKSAKMAQLDVIVGHLQATKAPRQLIHRIFGYYEFMWDADAAGSLKSSAAFDNEVQTLPRSLQVSVNGSKCSQ
jgi:hypothetical protein